MSIVLAAIDSSSAARPVLDTALGLAALTDATVEAVHVRENASPTPAALAAARGIAFRELEGDVEQALIRELHDPDVIVGVAGARGTPGGRRPVGRTALRLLVRAAKPLVVVPPDAVCAPSRPPRRFLIPLEGTDTSARAIALQLVPLTPDGTELVVVHVFTTSTAPPMMDHPEWNLELWRDEFQARYLPAARCVHLRSGPVGARIIEAATETGADMIVLSWSQDAAPGRAAVVRAVLEHAQGPILLLPVG